jgi:hypothetical protein
MKGVQYFYDKNGEPQAVMIDLKKNRRLWEDIQDILVARQRRSEPTIPWEKVQENLRKAGKLA